MEFSEEWKSPWTISSVFDPPSLISRPKSKSLGPLLFTPSPKTSNLLLSSSHLAPPFTTTTDPHDRISSSNNNLCKIQLSKTDFLLFFVYGGGQDRVGVAQLSSKGPKYEILGEVMVSEDELDGGIERISVSSVLDGSLDFSSSGKKVLVLVGFLVAYTVDCVHWYRIELDCRKSGKSVLVYLGSEEFMENVIVHACWNPHLGEECLVLLDNGGMLLFDVRDCPRAEEFPVRLVGRRVDVCWNDFELDREECCGKKSRWLGCGFSWHPRIFVVAHSRAIFLVDWRFEESNVTVLAQVDTFHLNRTIKDSRFIAFVGAGSDGFYFAVATEDELFLMDVRKPMMPVLQWLHGLDYPRYIEVFKLSELRSSARVNEYKWASDSGFTILLGSFFNSKFCLFCYGPPLLAPDDSVASRVSKFSNSFRAWELPTEISLLSDQCDCGNGLLEHDFSSAALSNWEKESIMGFCIIEEDLSDHNMELSGSSGFTLIRLLSTGKLESLKYVASCDFPDLKPRKLSKKSSTLEDSFLELFIPKKYEFPKRFRYLHLDSLLGFMNSELPRVLMSKMMRTCHVHNKITPYTQEIYERICEILRAAGVDSVGFCPTIENVLSGINWPMSIEEITSSRMWGGLNIGLLQLAFTIYSELVGVLVEHRKISLEALDIPQLPQLPPFFSKIPTSRSHKWSWNLQLGDVLVGPVLPLPYLLALPKIKKDTTCLLEEKEDEDEKMSRQCHKILVAARKMTSSGGTSELNGSPAVSLANDREERWASSKDPKPLFFHKPSAFSEKNRSIMDTPPWKSVHGDEYYDTFVSKTREKDKDSVLDTLKEVVSLDVFDDMCPVELNFDFPEMSFGTKELKGYKVLKRQFSQWQDQNTQYQDFCRSLNIHKTAF